MSNCAPGNGNHPQKASGILFGETAQTSAVKAFWPVGAGEGFCVDEVPRAENMMQKVA
jgi:hypothetical protein